MYRRLWSVLVALSTVLALIPTGGLAQSPPEMIQLPLTTLRVRALIDGRSALVIQGSTVHWLHYDFAAPGRHLFVDEPTYLNGEPWYPIWPDIPDEENRDCNCSSSTFIGIPTLAEVEQEVTLERVDGRHDVFFVEQPTADNDFTLIVAFDDNRFGGSAWYEIVFTYQTPIPIQIDIEPNREQNVIDLNRGTILVGIITPQDLASILPWMDHKNWRDSVTLTFGHTGEETSLRLRGKKGIPACKVQDINKDSLPDLVCQFDTQKTGFQCGDTLGILRLQVFETGILEGRDLVQIEGCQ